MEKLTQSLKRRLMEIFGPQLKFIILKEQIPPKKPEFYVVLDMTPAELRSYLRTLDDLKSSLWIAYNIAFELFSGTYGAFNLVKEQPFYADLLENGRIL